MNKFFCVIIAFIIVFNIFPVRAENNTVCLYVSTDGSDKNDGTENSPFKTIEKVKQTINNKNLNNVTVYIDSGVYTVTESVSFTEESSNKNIRYVGIGEVLLTGADKINAEEFQNITDEKILDLLPEESISKVKCVDLTYYGDLGNMPIIGEETTVFVEPYADGKPMHIAQYPNKGTGCLKVGDVINTSVSEKPVFTYEDDRISDFKDIENIWAYGGYGYYWDCYSIKLSMIDIEKKELNFSTIIPYVPRKGQEYILYNVVENLDAEGEYYIDRENKKLYFYPYEGMELLYISKLTNPLIKIDSCSNLYFENISFAYSSDKAIDIKNSSEIEIKNCKFYNLGNNAINIEGGGNISISGCDITQTGIGGIYIDSGDRKTLTHGNVVVDNCEIHCAARRANSSTYCIRLYGCGNVVKNSRLYDMPHFAIAGRGNEHVISNNEIYNVCNMNTDCGAIYFYGDWSYCGNVIKNNYFHDIYGRNGKNGIGGARCIYFDEMISGNEVTKNIFAYTEEGVFVHGGRNNKINENLFFDCKRTATVEAIAGIENFSNGQNLIAKLTSIPFMTDAWYEKYPFLSQIYEEYKEDDNTYKYPKDNSIENNVIYNSSDVFMNKIYALPYSDMNGNIQKELVLYR